MLEVVGHPVVVNPDKELRRIAVERGWDVLRFDRLGRRLQTAAVLVVTAAGSGLGSVLLARRTRPLRRRLRRQRTLRRRVDFARWQRMIA
jgi:hypothetical protein